MHGPRRKGRSPRSQLETEVASRESRAGGLNEQLTLGFLCVSFVVCVACFYTAEAIAAKKPEPQGGDSSVLS